MNYFRKTLVWIILLAVLGGYLYIYEIRGGKEREEAAEEARRLFRFTPDDVIELSFKKAGSDIHLIKDERGWMMEKPVQAKADDQSIHTVLQYITETKNDSKYVMDDNPTPQRLVEFGLANPFLQVDIKVQGDSIPKTMYFGDRGPTQNIAYAMLKGDPKVYRVVADARAEADQDAYYFRDKTIVSFKPFEVDKLEININNQVIRAELPMQGRWEITGPIKARADIVQIMELLSKLSDGKVKAFIDEDPSDLNLYGLKPPRARMTFWKSGDNSNSIELLFGDKDIKKRGVYVKRKDASNVFLLEEDVWDTLPRDVSHLRDHMVFFFEEDKVEKIQLTSPGKVSVWEKTQQSEWREKASPDKPVEFSIIKDLLERLKALPVKEFVIDNPKSLAQYGLDKPAYSIKLQEKNFSQELAIGKKDDKSSMIYALMDGNSVILLGSEILDLFKIM